MATKIGQIQEEVAPPPTIRGVQSTTGVALGRITLDWVSATFPFSASLLDSLSETFGPWDDRKNGAMGYSSGRTVLGTGALFWNIERPEMGIHLVLPAQALALWQFAPVWLLEIVKNNGGSFTRIDLAIDDFEGRLYLPDILDALENGNIVTRWKQYQVYYPKTTIGQKTGQMTGITIGSRDSENYCRFYDKRAEQEKRGVTDLPDNWIRFELEVKFDRADAMARRMIEEIRHGDLAQFVGNLVLGLLDFKVGQQGNDSNKSRWSSSKWWTDFLGSVTKERLTLPKFERTIEQVKDWFSDSVSPLACVIMLSEMENGQSGYDWLMETIADGQERFKLKHKKLIAGFQDGFGI